MENYLTIIIGMKYTYNIEIQEHYAKLNKSDTKDHTLYDSIYSSFLIVMIVRFCKAANAELIPNHFF